MATVRRPLRADAQRNRDAILAAAREVFDAEGVMASLDGIALRAGVGNATLYRNFPTRDDLLAAVMETAMEAALAEADELASRLAPREALAEWLVRLTWQLRIWHDLPYCLASARAADASPVQPATDLLVSRTDVFLRAAETKDVTADEVYELLLALSWAVDRFGDDEAAARRRVSLATAGIVG
ncbi:TetR/AcrR family transcriptional regulator [Paractinoplanes atraurantiacus]|uniref:Regulatory protein, tetR family n=1 Tax=Paractinoplanes atraurantiacus TaxID=1036182 RepID=A0A285JLZ2_9ACTN|nr:TetR/AcrR family transcriptional regulator [Actinoplanes atraurantiacus]SNY61319.1 regulatory protein, tetR family [Actinoplanes atraurantiacus]